MKAKAMKKTLSCILALTLTASMMAESLTAFAAGTKTENTSISGNGGAPEDVEDDAESLPAGAVAEITNTESNGIIFEDATALDTAWKASQPYLKAKADYDAAVAAKPTDDDIAELQEELDDAIEAANAFRIQISTSIVDSEDAPVFGAAVDATNYTTYLTAVNKILEGAEDAPAEAPADTTALTAFKNALAACSLAALTVEGTAITATSANTTIAAQISAANTTIAKYNKGTPTTGLEGFCDTTDAAFDAIDSDNFATVKGKVYARIKDIHDKQSAEPSEASDAENAAMPKLKELAVILDYIAALKAIQTADYTTLAGCVAAVQAYPTANTSMNRTATFTQTHAEGGDAFTALANDGTNWQTVLTQLEGALLEAPTGDAELLNYKALVEHIGFLVTSAPLNEKIANANAVRSYDFTAIAAITATTAANAGDVLTAIGTAKDDTTVLDIKAILTQYAAKVNTVITKKAALTEANDKVTLVETTKAAIDTAKENWIDGTTDAIKRYALTPVDATLEAELATSQINEIALYKDSRVTYSKTMTPTYQSGDFYAVISYNSYESLLAVNNAADLLAAEKAAAEADYALANPVKVLEGEKETYDTAEEYSAAPGVAARYEDEAELALGTKRASEDGDATVIAVRLTAAEETATSGVVESKTATSSAALTAPTVAGKIVVAAYGEKTAGTPANVKSGDNFNGFSANSFGVAVKVSGLDYTDIAATTGDLANVHAYGAGTPADEVKEAEYATVALKNAAVDTGIDWSEEAEAAVKNATVLEETSVAELLKNLEIDIIDNRGESGDNTATIATYNKTTKELGAQIAVKVNVYNKNGTLTAAHATNPATSKEFYGTITQSGGVAPVKTASANLKFPVLDKDQYAKIQVGYFHDSTAAFSEGGFWWTDELAITIAPDSITSFTLATTDDFAKVGAIPTTMKQGGTFVLGGVALKATLASDTDEFIVQVPTVTGEAGSRAITAETWYKVVIPKDDTTGIATALNDFLDASATYYKELAKATEEQVDLETKLVAVDTKGAALIELNGDTKLTDNIEDIPAMKATDATFHTVADGKRVINPVARCNNIHINFTSTTNPGSVTITYGGAAYTNSAIKINANKNINGDYALAVRETDQQKDTYNGNYIIEANRTAGTKLYYGNWISYEEKVPITDNPSTEVDAKGDPGLYELKDGNYVKTTDTTKTAGKKYYDIDLTKTLDAAEADDGVLYFEYEADIASVLKKENVTVTINYGNDVTKTYDVAEELAKTSGAALALADKQITKTTGYQWVGVVFTDPVSSTQKTVYIPALIEQPAYSIALDCSTATQKLYYKGEPFNPDKIKVTLSNATTGEKKEPVYLTDLTSKGYKYFFNNGTTAKPTIPTDSEKVKYGNVRTAIENADALGTLVVYNLDQNKAATSTDFAVVANYIESITVAQPTTTEYYVGFYPTATAVTGNEVQAAMPDIAKLAETAKVTFSFADKTQKDITLTLDTPLVVDADEGDAAKLQRRFAFSGDPVNGYGAGTIIIEAPDGITALGNTTVGEKSYRVTYVPTNANAKKYNTVTAQSIDLTTKQVGIKTVEPYDGVKILDDDYFDHNSTVDTDELAKNHMPTTLFYVGETVYDPTDETTNGLGVYTNRERIITGFAAGRNPAVAGTKRGSIVVTYSDGKKEVIEMNADLPNGKIVIPTIDATGADESRIAKIAYKVNKKSGKFDAYSKDDIKVTLSVKQDTIAKLVEANNATFPDDMPGAQPVIVFYQGDTDWTITEIADAPGAEPKKLADLAEDEEEHIFIGAIYDNRYKDGFAYDLLDSSDFAKFTVNEQQFKGLTAEAADNQKLVLTLKQGDEDVQVEVAVDVRKVPVTATIDKSAIQTIYADTQTPSVKGGKLNLTFGGQHPEVAELTFDLDDIINGTVDTKYANRFKVTDEKNKVVTAEYLRNIGAGDHKLYFKFYTNDSILDAYSVTAILNINVQTSYVKELTVVKPEGDNAKQYVGESLVLDKATGATATWLSSAADAEAKTFNLDALAVYGVDEDGNAVLTGTPFKKAKADKNEYKNAYITVAVCDEKTGKYSSDYEAGKFAVAGTHYITVYVDDCVFAYEIEVLAVAPQTIVIGNGTTAYSVVATRGAAGVSTPSTAVTYGNAKGVLYQGQELNITAGDFLVNYTNGTSKVLKIKEELAKGTLRFDPSTYKKDVVGPNTVEFYYKEGDVETAEAATVTITVTADSIADYEIKVDGSAPSELAPITFYVGEDGTTFYENQKVTCTFTYASQIKIENVDLSSSELLNQFTFTRPIVTSEDLTAKSPAYDRATVKIDGVTDTDGNTKTTDIYYTVKTVTKGELTHCKNEKKEDTEIKTKVYSTTSPAFDLTGYVFDLKLIDNVDTKFKGVDLNTAFKNTTNYTVALITDKDYGDTEVLASDSTDIKIADLSKATNTYTAGTYQLAIAYTAKKDGKVAVKTGYFILPDAKITLKAATDMAASIEVTTAPKEFGHDKTKIVIPQYKYADGAAFIADLLTDDEFTLTAKNSAGTVVQSAKETAATGIVSWDSSNFEFDADSITFDKAGTSYKLKVKYDTYETTIDVTIEPKTITGLDFVAHGTQYDPSDATKVTGYAQAYSGNHGIRLGAGEKWDGKDEDGNPIFITAAVTGLAETATIDLSEIMKEFNNDDTVTEVDGVKVEYTKNDLTLASNTTITITVTYAGKTAEIKGVPVYAVTNVGSLKFTQLPTKLAYKANEEANLDGAKIVGKFNAGVVVNYTAEVTDLSLLQLLSVNEGDEGEVWIGVQRFGDKDTAVTTNDVVWNAPALPIHIAIDDDVEGEFSITKNTPQAITVSFDDPEDTVYYLAYKGENSKNAGNDRLKKDFTTTSIDEDEDKATLAEQFTDKFGKATITYKDAKEKNVILFKDNVGNDADHPISLKINNSAEIEIPKEAGTYDANVSYTENGKTVSDTFKLTVAKDEITKITLTNPQTLTYLAGESLNLTGAKLAFEFKSGRKVDDVELPSENVRISGYDPLTVGKQTVTVEYIERDAKGKDVVVGDVNTFEVEVLANQVEKIEVAEQPDNANLYFTSSTKYDLTGGVLAVTFKAPIGEDESGNPVYTKNFPMTELLEAEKEEDRLTIDEVDFTEAGNKKVKLHYQDQETTMDIIIKQDTIKGIVESTDDPIVKTYALKATLEDFIAKGSVVISYRFSDDKTIPLSTDGKLTTGLKIEWPDTEKEGEAEVKITYTEGKETSEVLSITIKVGTNTVDSITCDTDTIKLMKGDKLDLAEYPVTITYKDTTLDPVKTTLANAEGKLVVKFFKVEGETETEIEAIPTDTIGTYKIKVTSNEDKSSEASKIINVTVEDIKVLTIKHAVGAIRVPVNGTLELDSEKVTITYDNAKQTTDTVSLATVAKIKYTIKDDKGETIEKIDTTKAGSYTVYVTSVEDPTFKDMDILTVTVSDLEVDTFTFSKTEVRVEKGDKVVDLTGITATVTYKNGTAEAKEYNLIEDASKFIINSDAVQLDTVGTYDIIVTLKEDPTKTATIKVTVYAETIKELKVLPEVIHIKKGTDLTDPMALLAILQPLNPRAIVTYTDGTNERTEEISILTDFDKFIIDPSGIDTSTAGSYQLNVALKADPTKIAVVKVNVTSKELMELKLNQTSIEVKTGDYEDFEKQYAAINAELTYTEVFETEAKVTTETVNLKSDDIRIKIEGSADISKAGVYPIIVRSTEDGTKFATLTITVVDGNKISDEDVDDVPEETPTINSRVVVFEKSGDEWTESKGFENLAAALDSKTGYGKGEGDYMFVIAGDISESSALKFPSKAKSITIVGDGKITLGKATTINLKQADISIDAEITGADLNVTLGAGKTLKIGERTKKLGKLTGNKSGSTLDILGSTTIGNILTFSKVYASDGSIITIPAKGKVQNIGTLKAEIVLDGTATVSGTTVDEGIFHLTKNGAAKQPIAKVTLAGETKTFLDIIIDNEDTAIDGGMKVLYGSGKFNAAKNVNIINKDKQGNDLNAVSYNNNKEVRAENTEAITYQIGEGEELSTSSFEALFDLLKTETGEVTVTVNSDSVISKNNIPKKLKSLTIKGASDDVKVTCNLTSFKVSYDLHFEDIIIDAVNAKGALNAITISSNGSSMSFINTNINSKSISITGNKKNTTLVISGLSLVDKLQNFKEVVVTGSAFINKNFAVETLMLSFDSFISFGNGCVVKITKLSGEGVIGLEKPENLKKFKGITLTSSDITEEGAVQLVEIKRESLNSMFVIAVAQNEGSFSAGTQIFTDKSKGAIAYDKIFDATGLKDEGKLTNTKGKVVLS